MPKRIRKAVVDAAIAQLDRVRESWLRRPGVSGLDVGYRITDGVLTDECAIRVHVERKLPPDALEPGVAFSTSDEPGFLGDFSIDVIEARYAPSNDVGGVREMTQINRQRRVNPLIGGVSVGHNNVSAGTLGAIVWDKSDGSPCMLSNWHVFCGADTVEVGDPIYQPGRLDGGRDGDVVGHLRRWKLDRDADAALAELTFAREYARDLLGLSPITGIEEEPRLGQLVAKSGRTTGVTEGMIDGVGMSLRLPYRNGPTVTFHDQIRIVPRPPWPQREYEVSRGGDSGSVWIAESSGKAVGLHFAGETDPSPTAEYAVANRMVRVAELLNFSVTPVFVDAPTSGPASTGDRSRRGPRLNIPGSLLRLAIRTVLCRHLPHLCDPDRDVSFGVGLEPGGAPDSPLDLESLLDEVLREVRERSE